MSDGNITKYIQMNPGANRLTLVCTHQTEGSLLTPPTIACASMPGLDASSWIRYLAWWDRSGRRMKKQVSLRVDASYVQGNILITRDGQARLGDFGIAGAFRGLTYDRKFETLRYMAPEHLSGEPMINGPSKVSDIYSLAMVSFEVRSSAVNHLTI
jgi:hypothetical protein